ncbi:hypothetical protein Ga0609869_002527 [Rhodovulum iodosum]|uniref:Uncharacterized protein n=1 Tax=Rhodovulum iodosum TaxID=68291 RepID=A0ABV3XVI7_9RHOB|nr:hypothetical protein [Rhodovulum robiginosum]
MASKDPIPPKRPDEERSDAPNRDKPKARPADRPDDHPDDRPRPPTPFDDWASI